MSNPEIPDFMPPDDNPVAKAAVERAQSRLGPSITQITNQQIGHQLEQRIEVGKNLMSAVIWWGLIIGATLSWIFR